LLFAQDVPSYSSVTAVAPGGEPSLPPKPKAAVCIPQPANLLLAVFKLPPPVQEEPLYSSVAPV
jgi:hypothetical protein